MRRTILAACLLTASAAPALAQNLDALKQALGQLPATVLGNPVPAQAYFVDVQALLALSNGQSPGPEQLNRLMLGSTLRPVEALAAGGPVAWESKAGVPLPDIRWFAGFGTPPSTVTFWGMKDADTASRLSDRLVDLGFGASGTPGVVSNGEPMAVDLLHADRADPWHSAVGAATFAAPKGDVTLVVASTPDIAGQAAADTNGAAANPAVATALGGLGQAVGNGTIMGAMLISPALGLEGTDPAVLLSEQPPDLETMRRTLEAQAAAASEGIPPYFAGLVADVQLQNPAVAIALTYPNCTIAKSAADSIAEKLKAAPEAASAQVNAGTTDGTEGLCAATVTVVMPDGASSVALLTGFLQGRAGALQIGG